MKINTYNSLMSFIALVVLSAAAFGQLSNDLQWTNDLINNSQPKTIEDRFRLTEKIVERLGKHVNSDNDIRALVRILEIERDLLSFEADPLSVRTNKAATAVNAADRQRDLDGLRMALLERASTLMMSLARPEMSPEDAKRIGEIAKSLSQAIDDIKDPSILGGASSKYSKLLTKLNGIASLAQAVKNPEARTIVSGLRNTLGTIDTKLRGLGVSAGNTMKAFDIPAEIAGAIIDNSRKGMDQTSAALDDISKAIGGDGEALKRMPGHAGLIETTLSPKTYGLAMFKALTDRVVDRIPFIRTLSKLFTPPAGIPSSPDAKPQSNVVSFDWFWSGQHRLLNEEDIFICAPRPSRKAPGEVNGTDRYTVHSNPCAAAVHAGVITFDRGGQFRLRFFPYDPLFKPNGSIRNGIASDSYDWSSLKKGSFVVLRAD